MILSGVNKKIVINSGHHDNDSGKVVITEVHKEAEEAKKIRDEVVRLLTEHTDFEVFSVPDSLDLRKSIDWANEKVTSLGDGLVIDIHLNANNDTTVRGAEAYYGGTDTSKQIAAALSSAVAESLEIPDRGARPDTQTFVGSLGWIRQTKGWASLIEVCYMTNGIDWAELNEEGGHERAALGIVNGICDIFGEERIGEEEEIEQPVKDANLISFIKALIAFLTGYLSAPITEEEAVEVKDRHETSLLAKKNVIGVGVGPRNKRGETSVIVLVEKKEDIGALSEDDMIPTYIDGVRTDVLEIGEIKPMAGVHIERRRPVYGGTSAIWHKGTACTLGAIVYRDGVAYALQNTHCANPHWKGAKIGDPIIQPSPNDGGKKTGNKDIIGYSSDYRELKLDGSTLNEFDSALVKLEVDSTKLYQEGLGGIKAEIAQVNVGDVVWKSGRTTGVQTSKVIAKDVTVAVNYGTDKPGLFKNQIIAENTNGYFTSGGDSSSLVVNENRNPVGQIFAGSDKIAIFSPIATIMNHFNISFVPDASQSNEGYVAIGKLKKQSYVDVDLTTLKVGTGLKTDYRMNVRTAPSMSGNKMFILKSNTDLEITEAPTVADGYIWAKVKNRG